MILTAAHLELAGLRVQRIVVEVHPTGDRDPYSKLVRDGLVLDHPDARHLLEHTLPPKRVKAVYLQLRVPDVFLHIVEFNLISSLSKFIVAVHRRD